MVAQCSGADIPGDHELCDVTLTLHTPQNTAWHPGSDSRGFTSAGGRRDSSVKQLVWHQGSLYSGDDAGVIVEVITNDFLFTSSELLQVGLHAGHGLEHQHIQ